MLGAAFAAVAPAVPSWKSGFSDGNNVGGLISAVLSPTGGFGKFLVVLLALSVPPACAPTMYTFGMSLHVIQLSSHRAGSTGTSFMSIAPIFARVPRYIFAIVSEVMSVPISL